MNDRDGEANWILPNRGEAMGDILFKFKRFAKTSTKYKECVTAAYDQGAMLFGFLDTKCWTSVENAASSYDSTDSPKESTKLLKTACVMVSETMFVYQKKR